MGKDMKKYSIHIIIGSIVYFVIFIINSAIAQEQAFKDYVFAANEVSNTISIIDPKTLTVKKTVPIGDKDIHRPLYNGHIDPHGVIASPDGELVLVTARGSSSLIMIDAKALEVLSYVTTSGREPHACMFTPDGRQAWITVRGSDHIDVFDRGSKKIVAQVATGEGPGMVHFEPSGRYAFVSFQKRNVVSVIDTYNYSVIKEISVPGKFSPFLMVSTSEKPFFWVIHKDVNKISVIDPRTFEVVGTVDVGNKPNHVAFIVKNGIEYAYITIAKDNRIDIIEMKDKPRFMRSVAVGQEPHGIWADPEMKTIFVGHEISNDVWAIDVATDKVMAKIPVGEKPIDVVYVRVWQDFRGQTSIKPGH
jgi:YVTN family beta-propeller protein